MVGPVGKGSAHENVGPELECPHRTEHGSVVHHLRTAPVR